MVLSRRKLFAMGSALVAASSTAIQGSQGDAGKSSTASLTRANFEAVVNSSFEIQTASGDRNFLVLASVDDFNNSEPVSEANFAVRPSRRTTPTPRTEAFALNFYGTGPKLLQNTYTVTHATLGAFDLFLVPSGNSYVALFNRLVGRAGRV
jgi:hypothetical protein